MATFTTKYGIGDDVSFPSRMPDTLGKLIPAKVVGVTIKAAEDCSQTVEYTLQREDPGWMSVSRGFTRLEAEVFPGILLTAAKEER